MMIAAMIPEKSAIRPQVTALRDFCDAYAAEVDGKDVERGIRGAACHAAHAADKRVGTVLLHCINHQSVGPAAA